MKTTQNKRTLPSVEEPNPAKYYPATNNYPKMELEISQAHNLKFNFDLLQFASNIKE